MRSKVDLFGIKDNHILELFGVMKKHPVTVIAGPAGSGKSTFLPYRLMIPPEGVPQDLWTRNGQIAVTQPRIQATRNIPAFVARSLHESSVGAGFDIGFIHKGSHESDSSNKLIYMTDGAFIDLLVRNEIGRFSVVFIDEVHERSQNIDLLLGLLKQQLSHHPHLTLLIGSATVDSSLFIHYFGGVEKVGFYVFPGKRTFSVEARFHEGAATAIEHNEGRVPSEASKKAFEILLAMETDGNPELISNKTTAMDSPIKGDVLVFLQGIRVIERTVELIRSMVENAPVLKNKVEVVPLYASLPQQLQDIALQPNKKKSKWRVTVSTSVAETSLIIPGIAHVIDSGLIYEAQWDSNSQTNAVYLRFHSKAGCQQRWQRAGRFQDGIAHCLYTKEQYEDFQDHTTPQFLKSPLENTLLAAAATGVEDVRKFDWIQQPSDTEIERALNHLLQIGALDEEGDLTEHGLLIHQLRVDATDANLMIFADRFGCAVEMASVLAMIKSGGPTKFLLRDNSWDSEKKRNVNRVHSDLMRSCQDDVQFGLRLWDAWEGSAYGRETNEQRSLWANQHYVDHELFLRALVPEREIWLSVLSERSKTVPDRPVDLESLERTRLILTYGLCDQALTLIHRPRLAEMIDDAPKYKPYHHGSGDILRSDEAYTGLFVEIGFGSILYRREVPELIIGSSRRQIGLQAGTKITTNFVSLTRPEWLKYLGESHFSIARYIARNHNNIPSGVV